MQALKRTVNLRTSSFYNKIAKFASNWTSNSMTGEANVRYNAPNSYQFNGFSAFNRNNVKTNHRVPLIHKKVENNKDYPNLSQKIAFLTGGMK